MIRTYEELVSLDSFEDRFNYLKLDGNVGKETFGFERFLNQKFYTSKEWRSLRDHIIVRDLGCDLGVKGYEIYGKIYIHHMNPIVTKDIVDQTEFLMNPNYLIATTHATHNAIHYGDKNQLANFPMERNKFDTCPWRLFFFFFSRI